MKYQVSIIRFVILLIKKLVLVCLQFIKSFETITARL